MLAINHGVALPTCKALSRVSFVEADVPREQWSVPTDCKRFVKNQAEEGQCKRHCTSCDNTVVLQGRKRARPADDVTQAAASPPVGVTPSRARPSLARPSLARPSVVMPPFMGVTRAGHLADALVSAAHAVAHAASKPVGERASAKWQKTTVAVPATVPDDKAAAPGQRGLADEINYYEADNDIFRDVTELEDAEEALAEFCAAL